MKGIFISILLLFFKFPFALSKSDCPLVLLNDTDSELVAVEKSPFFKKLDEAREFKKAARTAAGTSAEDYAAVFSSGMLTGSDAKLLERLGCVVERENGVVTKIKFPLPQRFARNYNKYMDELKAAGKIQEKDILKPGQIVVPEGFPPTGKLTFPPCRVIGLEEDIAKGFKEYPSGILESQDFNHVLSQGYFPFGNIKTHAEVSPGKLITMYEHDFVGHFLGFMRDPEYMKAVRNSYTPAAIEERRLAIIAGNLAPDILMWRENIALEQLATVRGGSKWREIPGLSPAIKEGKKTTKIELMKYYRAMSEEELAKSFKEIDKRIEEILSPVAGNNASGVEGRIIVTVDKMNATNPCAQSGVSLLGTICRMRLAFSESKNYQGFPSWYYLQNPANVSREIKMEKLSELLITIQELEKITPAEWASAVLKPTIAEDSKLYKVLCDGELANIPSLIHLRMVHNCPF